MTIKSLSVLLLLLALIGCSSVAYLKTEEGSSVNPAATTSEHVKVYSVSNIGREYVVIGQVVAAVDAGSDAAASVSSLKAQAAQLGADAIINLRLEVEYGYWSSGIKSSGTAVRFK